MSRIRTVTCMAVLLAGVLVSAWAGFHAADEIYLRTLSAACDTASPACRPDWAAGQPYLMVLAAGLVLVCVGAVGARRSQVTNSHYA